MRKSEFPRPVPRRTVVALCAGFGVIVVGLAIALKLGVITLPSASEPVAQYEATVVINDGSFVPSVLQVKPGTRVFFDNEGTQNHRVDPSAAAPDATFGSTAEILPSSGYVFSFFKTGEYTYHDGDNPTVNGEILVK
ncbi:MAG TPA: cupredoxin domain-containing protein [Candidatus Saccharimonadia bacterium]|nr:cupredoxin domain-containing protein [Candidatus Saccharimonadia bacterium]